MARSTQSNLDSVLGRTVVELGLATEEDVEACMKLQRLARRKMREKVLPEGTPADQNGTPEPEPGLDTMLVEHGYITQRQMDRLRPKLEEKRVTQQIPDFHIIEKLGAGAMATVYKAKQLSLDRMVAIKILPKKYTNNKEFVERFYAEGRSAAQLNHSNIVGAFIVGKAGEFHYFVMEYVDGKTVYDDIAEGKPYTEKEALDIILQIARALDHAHKQGFIHRDIKPKNIMITKDGVAKLADMGLARAVSDREAAEAEQGKAYGTPYYISPEQIRGSVDVDFRCDIYGLGATFYHMVTGQVPFDADNPSAVMHKHLKEELIPPDHINPHLSTGIGEIIELCMRKKPGERYSSTGDLLDDLEAVARGEAPRQARAKISLPNIKDLLESKKIEPVSLDHDPQSNKMDDLFMKVFGNPILWFAMLGWMLVIVLIVVLVNQ